jgi:hypothetical protein
MNKEQLIRITELVSNMIREYNRKLELAGQAESFEVKAEHHKRLAELSRKIAIYQNTIDLYENECAYLMMR